MKPFRDPPPLGPPWDLPLAAAPLAFVDLEMTGLDLEKDRVLEVCIERVVGGALIDSFTTLLQPEMPTGAQHVHGIDAAMVEKAPRFAEIIPRVEAIMSGAILVAHGAKWDVDFLNMELARAGTSFAITYYLDTLTLSRRALGLPSHSLAALCDHFGISRENAHRAEADVAALRVVWDRVVTTLDPKTARDLWEVRIAERLARAVVLGACEEAKKSGKEVQITYRPSRKKPEILAMIVTDVVSSLDPPRVIGYLVSGRSRRELRADRILRVESSS